MLARNRGAGAGFSAPTGAPKTALLGGISDFGNIKPLHARQDCHAVRGLGSTRPAARQIRENTDQIAGNVTGSFAILAKWSLAERSAAVNDDKAQVTPKRREAGHDR